MTRDELIDSCKFSLNVNDSQTNDDVSDASWIRLVNNAYQEVWNRLALELAPKGSVVQYVDKTWTAGSFTYTLPAELKSAVIYELWYLDSNSQPYGRVDAIFGSRDILTLNYLQSFSPGGFNFRLYFIPDAEKLATASSEPQLIPSRHHQIIEWQTLITIKMLADKEVPQMWLEKYQNLELSLMKEFSSRPLANRPNVRSLLSPIARPLI